VLRRRILEYGSMFVFGASVLGAMYLFGIVTHKYQLWPLSLRHSNPHQFDEYGRLASYPGKQETPCPAPDYVIVILGQSRSHDVPVVTSLG
jgi:hypothetical protein